MVLTELLDVGYLQLLQDNFVRVTGLAMALLSPDGVPLTEPAARSEFRVLVEENEHAGKRLAESRQKLLAAVCDTGETAREEFFPAGVMGLAVPVVLEGKTIGCWMSGLLVAEHFPEPDWSAFAAVYSLDADKLREAHQALPRFSAEQLENAVSFLQAVSHTIAQLIHYNVITLEANSELVRLGEQLELTAAMLRHFSDLSDVGIYVSDYFNGDILMANKKYASFAGVSAEELVGRKCWSFVDADNKTFCSFCPQKRLLNESGEPAGPVVWENYLPRLDIWLRLTSQAIHWVDGRLAAMVTFLDITDQKRLEQQLMRMAFYDGAQQLPNARKFAADLREQGSANVFLLCCDAWQLRKINNIYGRATGDAMLRAIASWLCRLVPGASTLYTFGGGEFCLLLRGLNERMAVSLAESAHLRFERSWELELDSERLNLFCAAALGVVDAGMHAEDYDSLRGVIERTLVSARKSGGVAVYNRELDRAHHERILLEMSLRDCARGGMRGFEVYYQPIADPATGAWCSLEALCRWTSPELGPIEPLVFIQEAEQRGLIGDIGFWVLETAVRQCKQWGLDERDGFLLDVNLSPEQLNDDELVERIMQILAHYDYPGGRLCLGITESTDIDFSSGRILQALRSLRGMGVTVTLDDFGAGYATFESLKRLPVGMLKAEDVFLQDIEKDAYRRYLLRVSVELAHAAGMKIIAEGVETLSQLSILLGSGVDYFQGFLFGRPMPARQIEPLLSSFYTTCDAFLRARKRLRDMRALFEDRGNYTLLPENYNLLSECIRLIGAGGVRDAMALLGTKLRLGRILLFTRESSGRFSCRSEWFSGGFSPVIEKLQNVNFTGDIPEWINILEEDGAICASDTAALPGPVAKFLATYGLHSAVVLPAYEGGSLDGFVCYADRRIVQEWQPETIFLLADITAVLGGSCRPAAFLT